jgi:hypothetical protein
MTTTIEAPAQAAFTIEALPAWAVAAYESKIAKANRKAARAGLGEPFGLTVAWRTVQRELHGVTITEQIGDATITGSAPSLPGWSFAATADWSLEAVVLHTSPFYTGPVLPRPASKVCDHCQTVRSRNETFLVTGPEGAVKQVGRQCLTVYTGIPVGWVALERDIAAPDDDDFARASGDSFIYDARGVIGLGIQLTDALGYVSQAKAEEQGQVSTRDRFLIAYHGPYSERERKIAEQTADALAARSRSDAEVAAEVEAIIAWAGSLDGATDYLSNVKAVVTEGGWLGRKHLGYALSAVGAYRRDRDHQARRAVQQAERAPVVVGRYPITGTVASVEVRDSFYGPQVKCRITLAGGTVLWGTLPASVRDAVPGDTLAFTATVTASDRDATFGFYSRPTGARITARGSES